MLSEKLPEAISEAHRFAGIDPQSQSFAYQLDFLKLEYEAINEIIKRIDEITQKNKEWAILIWAGSISLAISQVSLREYILLTAALPILFWFIDAWWRQIQKTCIFRITKISEFLNGPDLVESFKQKRLINFHVLDPRGLKYSDLSEYRSIQSPFSTMRYVEVGGFYLGLVVLSIALGLFFILFRQ